MDSITEAYIALQTEFLKNVEVGDRFRVLRKSYRGEMGYEATWASPMDDIVGKIGVFEEVWNPADCGIGLRFDTGRIWYVPWFVLEVLPKLVIITVGSEEFQVDKEKAEEIRRIVTS